MSRTTCSQFKNAIYKQISGSSDDHAYIWKIGEGPQPLLKLDGHGAEVTCVAWSSVDITKVHHFLFN